MLEKAERTNIYNHREEGRTKMKKKKKERKKSKEEDAINKE